MFESTTVTLAKSGLSRQKGDGRAPYRSWKRTRAKQWNRGRKAYKK